MTGVVADRVIVELEAKLDRYEANVRRAEQKFDSATKKIQSSARHLESSISRSTALVGSSLRAMAASLAAAFAANRIKEFADGYTRFTNQLKVAGLEGQALARTQERLFTIAQQYGVELESLGTLYSRGAQVANELGASQAQLIQFTRGVAAALKIQGTSATESRGALLQLSQLLASGTVRAEEFNSVNEGALPILKAVAQNITAAGGSVGKLKLLVNEGKISSQQFFDAFLKGSAKLEDQAAKSTLTIGNAFTILNNALGKFIGETDKSLSATERISQAIIALSNNLDTVVKALGLLGAVLLGRVVAGMVAASAATGLMSTALFAMQARAIGAATTMEALALVGATAGRSLLAAFGGPVGIAVAALTVGIYYLATATGEAAQATGAFAKIQLRAKENSDKVSDALDTLATATGKARAETLSHIAAIRAETAYLLENARAAVIAAQAKAKVTQRNLEQERAASKPMVGVGSGGVAGFGLSPSVGATGSINAKVEANLAAARAAVAGFESDLKRIDSAVRGAPYVRSPAADGKKKKTKKGKDPEDIERRFVNDLERGLFDLAQAEADTIGTLKARRNLELERIESERLARIRAINADDDYNKAQRIQLLELNEEIALQRRKAVAAEAAAEAAEEAVELSARDLSNERDLLEAQGRMANTLAERRDIELRLLDLQYREERLRLEAIRDNERLNDAERTAARRRLATLDKLYPLDRQDVERRNEGVGASYMRGLNAKDINEQLDQVRVNGLQRLEDQLTDTISKVFQLGGAFGDVASSIIADLVRIGVQRAIIAPLANMLFGPEGGGGGGGSPFNILASLFGGSRAGGGGLGSAAASAVNGANGGGLSDVFSSILSFFGGRASGGHVNAGQVYRVNETGIEGFKPAGSGQIVPLGRMREANGGTVVNLRQSFVLDARWGITTPQLLRHVNNVASQRAGQAGAVAYQAAERGVIGSIERFGKLGT